MLTRDYYEQHLYYDPTSPSGLRWKTDRYWGRKLTRIRALKGDVAGGLSPNGYWYVNLHKKRRSAHRVIMILHGFTPQAVDHKNGQEGGNIIDNLRSVTNDINTRNKRKRANNTSGVTGVKWEYTKKLGRKPILYAAAFWMELDGKPSCKSFRPDKVGLLPAFKMAVLYRQEAIARLNAAGAGYSERHGK